jgi:serine/threonine protein kinase
MPDVMKTVGRYEILREVGRGGMAMVYLARQSDLDRFVALKELGAFHASDPSFAQRFLRESRVAGSLSHPNIVTVHDYFEHDGTPYIAMEYVERGSLRPYVGKLTLAQIGGVLEGLLAGLTHAESHGIVHRDLKPENLMVTADGRVKIADFGIAKATTKMQTGAFLTATGTTVGTPTYMAPEQAMAQDIGPWTDLYSVGCMAFELFTGNVPFHDSDAPMAILLRHVNEPIPPVKSLVPEVDQRISDWIEALLVKDPTQRTQNAQDAWDEFEEVLLGLLGPRWRRAARLVERAPEEGDGSKPLTPAPFQSTHMDTGSASEEFKSFAWGQSSTETGPQAAPPMFTPPPSESTPAIPEPVTGPPTPMPSQAVPAPPAPPEPAPAGEQEEPIGETGFVTFGQPAPPPPTDALVPPPPPPPEPRTATPPPVEAAPEPEPAAEQPVEVAPEPEPAAPEQTRDEGGVVHKSGFDTYVAPPPARPPTSEPPSVTPPGVESAPPEPEWVITPPEQEAAATQMPKRLAPEPAAAEPNVLRVERERKPRSWIFPSAIAGGVVVAAVIGLVAGGGGGDKAPPPVNNTPAVGATTGGLSLKVPAGWSAPAKPPAVPGLPDATSLAGPSGGTIEFGKADDSAANSALLAQDLIDANGSVPKRTAVDLGGGMQAYRYPNVKLGGDRTATIFAVPTSAGVATLACIPAKGAEDAFAPVCDAVATTFRSSDGKPFPVGPNKEYAQRLSSTLTKLGKQQGSAAAALKRAKTRGAQAGATGRLAAAYAGAAKSLDGLELSPADVLANTQLVRALKATGAAYKQAAKEARSKDRAGYRREGAKAVAAQADVAKNLELLGKAGYDVQS